MSELDTAWSNVLRHLSSSSQTDYLNQPFPTELDEDLTLMVRAFRDAGPIDRRRLQEFITDEHSYSLLAYSERMASLAVREWDSRRVLDGLLAIAMEGFEFDARDALIRLTLLYHSAVRLGVNAQLLFDAAADLAPPDVAQAMRGFTRLRKPEDRTLKAMGYRESESEGPLVYKRLW